MTARHDTTWPIEPHTQAKHEILRRYLEAWFPILSTHHKKVAYIDGFCGPGRYENGEPGSPIIAIDVAKNHRKHLTGELVFLFFDERLDRIEQLNRELASYDIPPNFNVHAACGLFHEQLESRLESLEDRGGSPAPTFAFVDPFGFKGIPLSVISRLLRHRGCEVLITFMIDPVIRFLEHPKKEVVQHIVEAFGTDECIRIAETATDRSKALRVLYQTQLMKTAKFVRFFEMRDQRNRPLYYLFFASKNRVGHVKMKEAMWKVDPGGDFQFSDATDPRQMVLFEPSGETELTQILLERFRGRGIVTGKIVRLYVEDETPFLNKHKTKALKSLKEAGRITVEKLKTDGKSWTRDFPDTVRLTFID